MKIIRNSTGKEITQEELALEMYKAGSKIVYCDIECIFFNKETLTAYILDECGNWDYIDTQKYKVIN